MAADLNTDRSKLSPYFVNALINGERVEDHEFDSLLPENLEELADVQFSRVRVARVVSSLLTDASSETSFVDLGSGVGKLCLLLALLTKFTITGIERRPQLVQVAKKLCAANLPEARVSIEQGDIFDYDWSRFDVLYLYNPFHEHIVTRDHLIDGNIRAGRSVYDGYVKECFSRFANLHEHQRVITYHGFGGQMPVRFQLLGEERVGGGTVKMWGL